MGGMFIFRQALKRFLFVAAYLATCSGGMTEVVMSDDKPIVIAHRGASGYRPEHTLAAYDLAIRQGADYIEPDLVMTRDGVLVARHDIYLSSTTDVASRPEFKDKKRIFEGKEDWFVFDFTLAELKQLKAIQPRAERGASFDGKETIPTLNEIVALVDSFRKSGTETGLYIEVKRPDIFQKLNDEFITLVSTAFNALMNDGHDLYFQCFDGNFLLDVGRTSSVPLIMLLGGIKDKTTGYLQPEVNLELFYNKVAGFGLNKALVVSENGNSSGILEEIKSAGAQVHIWTIRNDVVPAMFISVEQELKFLYGLGADGVFTDYPDTAVQVRQNMELIRKMPF